MKQSDPLLSATNVGINLDGRQVLDGVNMMVRGGEITTLIGPNGAGKTTLVRIILGLLKPDTGRVDKRPGLRIGYMPQKLSLSENLPLTVSHFLRLSQGTSKDDVQLIGIRLNITHLLKAPMQKLSGGEHQRVLLARALLLKPDLLVLDEPVQGVDVTGQTELYRLIGEIRDEFGCGVLMVSHDLHLVMAATDHVMCINRHVCCSGHPDAVSQHPAYLEMFGMPANSNLAIYTHHHNHSHDIHGNVIHDEREPSGG